MTNRHTHINKLKRFFNSINFPFHGHGGYERAPEGCRFPGIWLAPDGLHFFQCNPEVSVGHIAHEAGHWALLRPRDRPRLAVGCFIDLGLNTCGEDMAADAWAGASAIAAGIPIEAMFTDVADYALVNGEPLSPYVLGLKIGTRLLTEDHAGSMFLRLMGMTRDYPSMSKWFVDEAAIAAHDEIRGEIEVDSGCI